MLNSEIFALYTNCINALRNGLISLDEYIKYTNEIATKIGGSIW